MRLLRRSEPVPVPVIRYDSHSETVGGEESCAHDVYHYIENAYRVNWMWCSVRECLRCGQRVIDSSRPADWGQS